MEYNFPAHVEEALANYRARCGQASALKRGRNPVFPYVPVILHPHPHVEGMKGRTEQILKRAYITREEAVACAQKVIEARVAWLRGRFNEPRCRAAREQWGLPREIPPATVAG